jgi:hypothetical protein
MRRREKTYIRLDGKQYSAWYLGKGSFTKAYVILISKGPYVILYGEDCTKEVLALWGDKSNPHCPKIWRYDSNIYIMPYYRPLTPEYRIAWKQYTVLKKIWNYVNQPKYEDGKFYKDNSYILGYMLVDRFIRECEKNSSINRALIDALQNIYDTVINCGSDCMFEFAVRNLGVDKKDRLVLRDIAFMISAVKR